MTRRQWLTIKALETGVDIFTAMEAVSSVAIEHPEWDLDEVRSWSEWEAQK